MLHIEQYFVLYLHLLCNILDLSCNKIIANVQNELFTLLKREKDDK